MKAHLIIPNMTLTQWTRYFLCGLLLLSLACGKKNRKVQPAAAADVKTTKGDPKKDIASQSTADWPSVIEITREHDKQKKLFTKFKLLHTVKKWDAKKVLSVTTQSIGSDIATQSETTATFFVKVDKAVKFPEKMNSYQQKLKTSGDKSKKASGVSYVGFIEAQLYKNGILGKDTDRKINTNNEPENYVFFSTQTKDSKQWVYLLRPNRYAIADKKTNLHLILVDKIKLDTAPLKVKQNILWLALDKFRVAPPNPNPNPKAAKTTIVVKKTLKHVKLMSPQPSSSDSDKTALPTPPICDIFKKVTFTAEKGQEHSGYKACQKIFFNAVIPPKALKLCEKIGQSNDLDSTKINTYNCLLKIRIPMPNGISLKEKDIFQPEAFELCSLIASHPLSVTTQQNTVSCLAKIKIKIFPKPRLLGCRKQAKIAVDDIAQTKAIACMFKDHKVQQKKSAKDGPGQPAGQGGSIQSVSLTPNNMASLKAYNFCAYQGLSFNAEPEIIQIPFYDDKEDYILHMILLKAVKLDGKDLGNILIYAPNEAKQSQSIENLAMRFAHLDEPRKQEWLVRQFSIAINQQQLNGQPLVAVKFDIIRDTPETLASLTKKSIPKEDNLSIYLGRIELISKDDDQKPPQISRLPFGFAGFKDIKTESCN